MSDSTPIYRLSQQRAAARSQRIAQSLYGQIRLTVTYSPTGRADYRALAKRPTADWTERDVFAMGHEQFGTYPPDFHSALEYFELVAARLRWMPSERG